MAFRGGGKSTTSMTALGYSRNVSVANTKKNPARLDRHDSSAATVSQKGNTMHTAACALPAQCLPNDVRGAKYVSISADSRALHGNIPTHNNCAFPVKRFFLLLATTPTTSFLRKTSGRSVDRRSGKTTQALFFVANLQRKAHTRDQSRRRLRGCSTSTQSHKLSKHKRVSLYSSVHDKKKAACSV